MRKELSRLLTSELGRRKEKNSAYSLRAFARDLGFSPAYLSLILNEKIDIKINNFLSLIEKVVLCPQEQAAWKEQISQLKDRHFFNGFIPNYKGPLLDHKITWKHYAIIEVFTIESFEPSYEWISKNLNFKTEEVKELISDLISIGALQEKNKQIVSTNISLTNITDEKLSSVNKKMQEDLLKESLNALETIPIEMRNHTSMTIGLKVSQLPKIKERIKEFRRELCCEINQESGNQADCVYQLQIALFPLGQLIVEGE